jgi:hypothetical protein
MRALIAGALLALPTLALAGPLADALDQDDANLYFSFETREGVWGNGESMSIELGDDRHYKSSRRGWRGREMTEGPAHVWIRLRDGEVRNMDVEVGGDPRIRSTTTTSARSIPSRCAR